MSRWLWLFTVAGAVLATAMQAVTLCDEPGQVKAGAQRAPQAGDTKENPVQGQKEESKEQATTTGAKQKAQLEAFTSPIRLLLERKDVPPGPFVAAAPQVARVVGDNDALTQQWVQQLRPILQAELGFIRVIFSELTVEQRTKIRAAAEEALKATAKQMANEQQRPRQAVIVNGVAHANPAITTDPLKTIRDKILKELETALTNEQLVQFRQESSKRMQDRRRASILALLSILDSQLFLTVEQREKIEETIAGKWKDEWENWLLIGTMYGHRYVPAVPDDCVNPHLSDDQRTLWKGMRRITIRNWTQRNGQADFDEKWWDGTLDHPRAANLPPKT